MKKSKKTWSNVGLVGNFVGAVAVTGISLVALRNNNLQMLELYKKVENADTSGTATYDHLRELQVYVASHMNATPPKLGTNPGIQLKGTYERAKKAESDRVTSERERVYNEAISYCEVALPKSLLSERAQCIIDRNASQAIVERQIVADLYRYDFVSPKWSADVAGWSVIASVVLIGTFVLQVIGRIVAKFIFTK